MNDRDALFFDENMMEKTASEKAEKTAAPDRIFLVGMMGAGKTSVGKKLARRLGWRFLDLDAAVEKAEKMSVAAIFEQKGEPHFRAAERRELQKTFKKKGLVVATGGGTACFFDNVLEMNRHGASVFLTVRSTALAERLWPEREKRPLIAGLEKAEFFDFLAQMLADRTFFYEKANLKIDAEKAPEAVAEAIEAAFFA